MAGGGAGRARRHRVGARPRVRKGRTRDEEDPGDRPVRLRRSRPGRGGRDGRLPAGRGGRSGDGGAPHRGRGRLLARLRLPRGPARGALPRPPSPASPTGRAGRLDRPGQRLRRRLPVGVAGRLAADRPHRRAVLRRPGGPVCPPGSGRRRALRGPDRDRRTRRDRRPADTRRRTPAPRTAGAPGVRGDPARTAHGTTGWRSARHGRHRGAGRRPGRSHFLRVGQPAGGQSARRRGARGHRQGTDPALPPPDVRGGGRSPTRAPAAGPAGAGGPGGAGGNGPGTRCGAGPGWPALLPGGRRGFRRAQPPRELRHRSPLGSGTRPDRRR